MRKVMLLSCFLFSSQWVMAEGSQSLMEGSGKIYVVLATVLAIYVGLMLFLTAIERKLSNLERQIKE